MASNLEKLTRIEAPLNAQLTVAESRELVGHEAPRTLALVDNGRIIGTLHSPLLVHAPADSKLLSLAEPIRVVLDVSTPLSEAARRMSAQQSQAAIITKEGKYLGVLSPNDFLGEVGRTFDPLTGLEFSDRLREWGQACLEDGQEITIIFIDLNDFGLYNKRYGHVVGDHVLQALAQVLKDHTPSDAVLVRFGGDEFAIGMPSERARAEALAETLRGLQVTVEGVPEPVGYSVGVAGGRRVGRTAEHGAANVDDLINAASRDALARKRESKSKRPRSLHEALAAVMQREDLGEGIIRDAMLIDRGPEGQLIEVIVSRPNHPEPRIVRRPVKGDLMAALETALRDAIR